MFDQTIESGGGTWQIVVNHATDFAIVDADLPDSGYLVGGVIPTVVIPSGLITPAALDAAVAYVAATLGHTLIGTWIAYNGDLHVDAVEVVPNITEAVSLAYRRGEQSYRDLATATNHSVIA